LTDTHDHGHDGDFVQSLERGLSVIRAFDAEHPKLTLSEVATSTGLSRAAARRFLRTLVQLGYMRSDGSRFALRPKILELGYAYLSSLTLPEVAMPHLEQLVEQVHESSSVSELDGDDVIYIARVPTKRIMTVTISVGTRFPAYATSMGRVLLAAQPDERLDQYLESASLRGLTGHTITSATALRRELRKIKTQGWALVDQELEEGLRSIAAPIRDADGQVIAAINVSTHAGRRTLNSIVEELLQPLLATARRIELDLARSRASVRARPDALSGCLSPGAPGCWGARMLGRPDAGAPGCWGATTTMSHRGGPNHVNVTLSWLGIARSGWRMVLMRTAGSLGRRRSGQGQQGVGRARGRGFEGGGGGPRGARLSHLLAMRTLVVDHPLVTHKLTALRDAASDTAAFRSLTAELVTLLAYEATREMRVQPVSVRTPVGEASGVKLAGPVPLIVPVLRAGIGMLDGMTRLLPMAEVGFVGLRRDEESLVASTYADRLPADLTGRDTFVLDPMLATGGTLATVISMLANRGAASVTAICLLAAPEGLRHVEAAFAADEVRVVTAAVDERLNEKGYIVPGLGDAGDRLFGKI
jgi:IclR family pca regulon transcriptional regulator